jgi:hypothetical protein
MKMAVQQVNRWLKRLATSANVRAGNARGAYTLRIAAPISARRSQTVDKLNRFDAG